MKLPAPISLQVSALIGTSEHRDSKSTCNDHSLVNISPQINYVSPSYARKIKSGEEPDPCPKGTSACFGTGKHWKGYECCDNYREECGHDATGRPICNIHSKAYASMVTNRLLKNRGIDQPEIGDHVGGFVGK